MRGSGNVESMTQDMAQMKYLVCCEDGRERALVDIAIGTNLLGVQGSRNSVLGFHRRELSGPRKMYRVNGRWQVPSDQLLWTEAGWAAIDPIAYRIFRYETGEMLESLNAINQGVIDFDKLVPINEQTVFVDSAGNRMPLTSIEECEDAIDSWSMPIMDGNQSYALGGGLVVDGYLGIRFKRENLT